MTPNQNPTATPTDGPQPQPPLTQAPVTPTPAQAEASAQVVPVEPPSPVMTGQPPVVSAPQVPGPQMPMPQPIPTTMGDRLSTGAVNAGLVGFAGLAVTAGLQGVRKVMDKAKVKNLKWFPKTGLWITAGAAAIAGIYSAATANRGDEKMREEALERAQRKLEDPNSPIPQDQRLAQFQHDLGVIIDGNAKPEAILKVAADAPSTSFQERVAESRANAATQQLGA